MSDDQELDDEHVTDPEYGDENAEAPVVDKDD